MDATSHAALLALALLAASAAAAPAYAEGLVARDVQATFKTSRAGLPRHTVKVRGIVTDTDTLRRFLPTESGLLIHVGAFTALTHTPDADGGAFRLRRGRWRLRTKQDGVITKLRIDTRSGMLRLDVKRANASLLRAGGSAYAVVRVEIGSRVLEDAVSFDERRRGGAVKWRSLSKSGPLTPPSGPPGTGTPLPGGTLPFTILSRGELSDVLQPTVLVARTRAEWIALYGRATFTVPHQRPEVDFTREIVLGVFAGFVSQVHAQEVDVVNVTEVGEQLHVSWRSRFLCTQFACTGGLTSTTCPDFSPFVFIRVRRVPSEPVSDRAPAIYSDCP